jgi:hypothetical protein
VRVPSLPTMVLSLTVQKRSPPVNMPLLRATRRAAPSIARAAASRSYRPVGAALRHCSTTAAIDEDLYHSLASCTLETIQEVYDDEADDNAQLNMEVEYSVRQRRHQRSVGFMTISRCAACFKLLDSPMPSSRLPACHRTACSMS